MKAMRAPGIAIALDMGSGREAFAMADRLTPGPDLFKVGLELFASEGPEFVRRLIGRGHRVFLDLKFHDIPNTVAGAVRSARSLGVDLLTVHASGGVAMLEAAVEAADGALGVVGVTVLTSLDSTSLDEAWGKVGADPRTEAVRLARLAKRAGLDGIVSSVQEARAVRAATDERFQIVTPGIRFSKGSAHDQARVATPGEALNAGSNLLVIGRAVTADPDPREALARVRSALQEAASNRAGNGV
jgi:orotidine-5'-phosphate decarboxylase